MPETHELVIIGSGPAGLTAAVYAGRANLAPVVIEGIGAGTEIALIDPTAPRKATSANGASPAGGGGAP